MTKECCVCGRKFETKRKSRKTCGDYDCQYAQHLAYLTEYARKRRKTHRKAINEYNRKWMREYRARQKAEAKEINSFESEGYAERQRQKTLAMAGKVQI
jgi:hypothetical protein